MKSTRGGTTEQSGACWGSDLGGPLSEDDPKPQLLLYARDLAALYARYDELQSLLIKATEQALQIARGLTVEEVGARLIDALRLLAPKGPAAAYIRRRERLRRVTPDTNGALPNTILLSQTDPELGYAGFPDNTQQVWLPGRRQAQGLVVFPRIEEPRRVRSELIDLLAGHAGVVIENLFLEQHRRSSGSRRAGTSRGRMVGTSRAMSELLAVANKLMVVDSNILLKGETGTGKSLLARYLHDGSKRSGKPMVTVNCAAIPAQLVESELFGHEAGAFTGAVKRRRGYVEQAEGGTLFLDEVADLPLETQAKLLVFLEDREFRRVGGETLLRADVRVISATNTDLDRAVEEGRFRTDLLYRLRVFSLPLPPLRTRGEDVIMMAESMARDLTRRYELPPAILGAEVRSRLLSYTWPGNARELRNTLEKAVILSEGGELDPRLFPGGTTPQVASEPFAEFSLTRAVGSPATLSTRDYDFEVSFGSAKQALIDSWERGYFESLLTSVSGNISAAARLVNVDKRHIHRKIKLYDIDVAPMRGG
ncbi:MAG: sigma-54-dependent Fis family transcriptional regulator [Planctomycetes bacterium]|nr:sigma-54-dependent Fis family transcriptional regulator [Planctomycetota bacterium]